MAGIKRTAADIAFSTAVRESFDYTCRRCGKSSRSDPRRMDCSHIISRGNWSTRFTVRNALCLCRGCHQHIAKRWEQHEPLAEEHFGKGVVDEMRAKAAKPFHGIKRLVPEIAKHYKAEIERLKRLRLEGRFGYIKLRDWESGAD